LIRLNIFAALVLLVVMCTNVFGRDHKSKGEKPEPKKEPQHEQYLRCQGQTYIDTITSGTPAKVLLELKNNTVKVTGAYKFTDSEIKISSETNSEISFKDMIAGTPLGDSGVFNQATGHLHINTNEGESQEVAHRIWGEYECKPATMPVTVKSS